MPHHTAPQFVFTPDEFQKMQTRKKQLLRLKTEVMERVKIAREMGDLSENGAYKYGKFELGNIRRELRRLHFLLEHGTVGTVEQHYEAIAFGCTFTLQNEFGERTFMLVNEYESNPQENKLSEKSPLGQAVMGKKRGDTVTFQSPNGQTEYRITHIQ